MRYNTGSILHRRHLLTIAAGFAASTALAGCLADVSDGDNGDDDEDGTSPSPNGDALAELATENRRFAFELYEALIATEPDANLFCSPHSISLALAMTYAGARGQTRDEISDTLHYTLGEDIHAIIEELAGELDGRADIDDPDEAGEPFTLNVANSVWGQAEYPFEEDYLSLLDQHYGGGLQEIDFIDNPEHARQEMNDRVAEQTNDTIEELLPEGSITAYVRLVLTNAVYFHAAWSAPFAEEATEAAPFTALDGTETEVPRMQQSGSFYYAAVDGHEVIELPYVGDEVSMVVVLPEEDAFESFEDELDVDRFDELIDALEEREGSIALPRFTFDSSGSLQEVLTALGMPTAFDEEEADFSGIADLEAAGENLFIHDVYHDAFVSVDEEGTEASAATGVVIGTDSAPADPFEMIVDRPFVFGIRDRPTDALLFVGRVVDAGAAQ